MGNVSERNDSSEIVLRKSLSSETFLRNRVVSKCFDEKTFCEKKTLLGISLFGQWFVLKHFAGKWFLNETLNIAKKGEIFVYTLGVNRNFFNNI